MEEGGAPPFGMFGKGAEVPREGSAQSDWCRCLRIPQTGGQRPEVTRRSEAVMNQNGCVLSKLF